MISIGAFAKSPAPPLSLLPLPLPPIPPAVPPPADAPMPDIDYRIPRDPTTKLPATLNLAINHREPPSPGLAFSPGSHYQLDNDRRWLFLPGIMLHVPFP
jgi:hypothetical protein